MPSVYAVDIVGLRDLQGRFASMRDGGLVAIQLVEATALGEVVREVFQTRAPKSSGLFASGFSATTDATDVGFEISIETDDPQLRTWLAEGTGVYGPAGARIYPVSADALGPIKGSGPSFVASIAGMPANHWEDDALAEVTPLVDTLGSSIGQKVVAGLSDA